MLATVVVEGFVYTPPVSSGFYLSAPQEQYRSSPPPTTAAATTTTITTTTTTTTSTISATSTYYFCYFYPCMAIKSPARNSDAPSHIGLKYPYCKKAGSNSTRRKWRPWRVLKLTKAVKLRLPSRCLYRWPRQGSPMERLGCQTSFSWRQVCWMRNFSP